MVNTQLLIYNQQTFMIKPMQNTYVPLQFTNSKRDIQSAQLVSSHEIVLFQGEFPVDDRILASK